MSGVVLETQRIRLRPYRECDFEDYFAYISDEDLRYWLGLNDVYDRESAWQSFNWLLTNRKFLAIELKETGHVIGHLCFHPAFEGLQKRKEYRDKVGESLSFAVAKPYQRKGLMREALSAVIDRLRVEKKTDFIDMEYLSENVASSKLKDYFGFQVVGTENLGFAELVVCVLSLTDDVEKE